MKSSYMEGKYRKKNTTTDGFLCCLLQLDSRAEKEKEKIKESSWNMHDALSLSLGLPPVVSFSTLSSLKDGTYRCENALTQTQ